MIQNVYIAGMGRSGTTLLQGFLNSHPNIVAPPESYFTLHLYTKYKNTKNWDKKTVTNFIKDLYTDRPFRLIWNIPKKNIEEAFEQHTIHSFSDACNVVRSCYNDAWKHKNIKIISDKRPLYPLFLNRLLRINPNAKIIHNVRDPRGTINSQFHSFNNTDVLALGHMWVYYNRFLEKFKQSNPEQYYLIRYEDLVADPEKSLRSLCDFLDIDYHQNMLNYQKELTQHFDKQTDVMKKKHLSLFKPLDPEIIHKWKQQLDTNQLQKIAYVTREDAKQYGYSLDQENTNFYLQSFLSNIKIRFVFFNLLRLFFSMPILFRKIILGIRSMLTDHKYKN